MALQDIINKIKDDAQKESNKLKAENAIAIKEVEVGADKEISAVKVLTEELSKKQYAEEKRLKVSLATLELKNKLLAAKQDLINQAFDKSLAEIKALPADKYKELLINALLKLEISGDEEVILGSNDSDKLGASFISDLNAAFSKAGKKADLKVIDERRDNISGCVLKHGRTETICTFESIITEKRLELERDVAAILFKE